MTGAVKKYLIIAGVFLACWLGVKYLLPVLLPFILGGLLAVGAEPLVQFSNQRLRLPRPLATGVGVGAGLLLLAGLLSVLGAVTVRELGTLANTLPDVQQTATEGMALLRDWLTGLTEQAPEGVRPLLTRTALELTADGTALVDQVTSQVPGVLTGVLEKVPGSAIGIGTGVIAGFMISARLPALRKWIAGRIPQAWKENYLPALEHVKRALGGWLKAQLKLSAVTWILVTAGLMLLRVRYAPAWAVLVAIIDAVPMLGTGLALIPCAVVTFLQGETLRGVGFLVLWAVAAGARALLEPRFVGRHLGLDPLITLVALYLGYRFWGILGMILAPMLTAAGAAVAAGSSGRGTEKKTEA